MYVCTNKNMYNNLKCSRGLHNTYILRFKYIWMRVCVCVRACVHACVCVCAYVYHNLNISVQWSYSILSVLLNSVGSVKWSILRINLFTHCMYTEKFQERKLLCFNRLKRLKNLHLNDLTRSYNPYKCSPLKQLLHTVI